jgi:hypothetical protein
MAMQMQTIFFSLEIKAITCEFKLYFLLNRVFFVGELQI